jgi:hypothetical protein
MDEMLCVVASVRSTALAWVTPAPRTLTASRKAPDEGGIAGPRVFGGVPRTSRVDRRSARSAGGPQVPSSPGD